MEEALLNYLLDFKLNLSVSTLCVTLFLFNYLILKTKKEYRGFNHKIFLVLLFPYFNLLFLFYNALITSINVNGYRIVKVKKKAKTVPATAKA